MTADSEARQIVAEIMDDFRRTFPLSQIPDAERRYLAALILRHVTDALHWDEDDHR